jgi:hypothetical protein
MVSAADVQRSQRNARIFLTDAQIKDVGGRKYVQTTQSVEHQYPKKRTQVLISSGQGTFLYALRFARKRDALYQRKRTPRGVPIPYYLSTSIGY